MKLEKQGDEITIVSVRLNAEPPHTLKSRNFGDAGWWIYFEDEKLDYPKLVERTAELIGTLAHANPGRFVQLNVSVDDFFHGMGVGSDPAEEEVLFRSKVRSELISWKTGVRGNFDNSLFTCLVGR